MTVTAFINILKSRLEDLGLENAYTEKKCADTAEYLYSLSKEELDLRITEEYLNSIVNAAKKEVEKQRSEAIDLAKSVASILEGDTKTDSFGDSKSSEDETTFYIPIPSEDTVNPRYDGAESEKTQVGYSPSPAKTIAGKTRMTRAVASSAATIAPDATNMHTVNINSKTADHSVPSQNREKHTKGHPSKIIYESDLNNKKENLIFTLLLILFSPTILMLFTLFVGIVLLFITFAASIMMITILLFAAVFVLGGALSVITLAYSFCELFCGNFAGFALEIGLFFIIFPMTLLLSFFISRLTKVLLPRISLSIVSIYRTFNKAARGFLRKCRKGCATL